MKLQEKLNEMKTQFQAKQPPEVVSLMQRGTDELIQSGIMDGVLGEGQAAPDFSLSDENGDSVNSRDLISNGPLVVSFYRGVW